MLRVKRIYEPAEKSDGYRVLVDRVWPRGIKRDSVDYWMKDIGPTTELRKWFGHDPAKWKDFRSKYKSELSKKNELLKELRALEKEHRTVTLLYGAKDEEHNQAVVLREMLSK